MTPTLEDVTRLTGLRVHGAALSGHSLTDYRHLVESYLGFSLNGEGALRGVNRSEFFSAVSLSRLHRGPESLLLPSTPEISLSPLGESPLCQPSRFFVLQASCFP